MRSRGIPESMWDEKRLQLRGIPFLPEKKPEQSESTTSVVKSEISSMSFTTHR